MIRLIRSVFITSLLSLSCCAPPPSNAPEQAFVPGQELDVVGLVRKGLSDYQRNRYIDAEFSFRQALYLSPKAANVRANLAAALRSSGQYDEAEDILFALNAAAPESLDYLSGLARLYVDKQEFSSAKRFYSLAYEAALKQQDFAAAGRFARNLSAVAFRAGDEASALCYSHVALSLKPDADSHIRHARLLLGMNRPADARTLLGNYLSGAGSQTGPVAELAVAELALGNNERALQLARSVETSSDLPKEATSQLKMVIALSKKNLGLSDTAAVPDEKETTEVAAQSRTDKEVEVTRASLYWPSSLLADTDS